MTQEFGVATFGSAVGDSFIMPLPDREPVRRSDVLIIIICTLYHVALQTPFLHADIEDSYHLLQDLKAYKSSNMMPCLLNLSLAS